MADDREPEKDDEDTDEHGSEDDGGRHDAADTQREHGECCEADDDHGIDDPLDDDRAEDRRPTDALPFPERVAADELAKARGKDVVREVADERVPDDTRVPDARDRRQERAPPCGSRRHVQYDRDRHQGDDREVRRPKHLDGGPDIDGPQQQIGGDDADGDPEDPASRRATTHRRAVSFGDGRRCKRWRR